MFCGPAGGGPGGGLGAAPGRRFCLYLHRVPVRPSSSAPLQRPALYHRRCFLLPEHLADPEPGSAAPAGN